MEDIKKAKAVTTPIIPPPSLDPATKTLKKNGQVVNVSHFFLVDLAGSERASKTGATNETLKEGAHINKSLLTLSTGFILFSVFSQNYSEKPHFF